MSVPSDDKPAEPTPAAVGRSASPVLPLAIWVLLQLASICLSALQFRWSSRFPAPAEHWALHVLLVTQITASALLFPVLLTDGRRLIVAIAATWPPLLLAGILAEASTAPIVRAAAYVAAWLVGLWFWRSAIRSARQQLVGTAILSGIVLAGPVLGYLGDEFGRAPLPVKGPIEAGLAMLTGPEWRDLLVPGAIALTGFVAGLIRQWHRKRPAPR